MTFLFFLLFVTGYKFRFPLIFAVSIHFPYISGKLLFPPYFFKFPPDFVTFRPTCFLHTYFMCFSFPHFTLSCLLNLCITQCTYWTPVLKGEHERGSH